MAGNLMSMFGTGNPFLTNAGYDQLATAQKDVEARLANQLFQTDANRQKLPAEIAQMQANTGNLQQLTRGKQIENDFTESIPLKDRQSAYFADLRGKLQKADLAQLDGNMQALRHYLSVAEQQPLSLEQLTTIEKTYPGLGKFLSSPQGIVAGKKAYQSYLESDPVYVRTRMQEQMDTERLLKGIKEKPVPAPKTPKQETTEISVARINSDLTRIKKASEKIAYLKVMLPQLQAIDENAAAQFEPIYRSLKVQADAEANARSAGQVDVSRLPGTPIPVRPPVDLGPSAVPSRPQQPQVSQQRVTIYKDGKAVGTIPANQVEQAKQQGYTVK